MKDNKFLKALGEPFPYSDVKWRLQHVDRTKLRGMAVPYLDARAIASRLDEVVGQNNWKDVYEPWHSYTEIIEEQGREKEKRIYSQLCTIFIYDEERGAWLGKTDGAENTDIESIKGGLSDAFKRAAVKWNIGRYMYKMKSIWVDVVAQGRSFVVAPKEEARLEAEYNKVVVSVFGTAPQPMQTAGHTTGKIASKKNTNVYEVAAIKVQEDVNGPSSSMVLTLGDKQIKAYMTRKDERLKSGTKITNVRATQKKNAYGVYALIDSYDIAA